MTGCCLQALILRDGVKDLLKVHPNPQTCCVKPSLGGFRTLCLAWGGWTQPTLSRLWAVIRLKVKPMSGSWHTPEPRAAFWFLLCNSEIWDGLCPQKASDVGGILIFRKQEKAVLQGARGSGSAGSCWCHGHIDICWLLSDMCFVLVNLLYFVLGTGKFLI